MTWIGHALYVACWIDLNGYYCLFPREVGDEEVSGEALALN